MDSASALIYMPATRPRPDTGSKVSTYRIFKVITGSAPRNVEPLDVASYWTQQGVLQAMVQPTSTASTSAARCGSGPRTTARVTFHHGTLRDPLNPGDPSRSVRPSSLACSESGTCRVRHARHASVMSEHVAPGVVLIIEPWSAGEFDPIEVTLQGSLDQTDRKVARFATTTSAATSLGSVSATWLKYPGMPARPSPRQ